MEISQSIIDEAIAWRQHLHAYPELGFNEYRTSQLVADVLSQLGMEVYTGIAETGVVGILKRGSSTRSIGLRADMDALPMKELNTFSHCSKEHGCMHACGHDGHTAMLLGAAKHLALHGDFDGCIYFIFQPAEENMGGGKKMVEEGLFERFAIDEIYGLHNMPGKPLGDFCVNDGAMMASLDIFDITLQGKGAHAAMPEKGHDPIVAAAELITSIQSIVSREISPLEAGVVSVTQIVGGDTYNIIPDAVLLKGTVRALSENVRVTLKHQLIERVRLISALHQMEGTIDYQERYPATVNDAICARKMREVIASTFGQDKVFENVLPIMASEDFSFMLNEKQGAYAWMGTDEEGLPTINLHNPHYDFNDHAIPIGIQFWVSLAEMQLAKQ